VQLDLLDRLAVDERARARVQVADEALAVHLEDDRVRGGDGVFDERDVAGRPAADEHRAALERDGHLAALDVQDRGRRRVERPDRRTATGLHQPCTGHAGVELKLELPNLKQVAVA
jgi:hypothetical protein